MRIGFSDVEFLTHAAQKGELEQFLGVNLGWDFTSEHEWGIERLQKSLCIDPEYSKLGAERRLVRCVDEEKVQYAEKNGVAYFGYFSIYSEISDDELVDRILRFLDRDRGREEKELRSAWNSSGFCMSTTKVEYARKLRDALLSKDLLVYLGKNSGYGNPGLMIVIKSYLPEEVDENWKALDENSIELAKADEATGIKKRLEEAGKRFYALAPRWSPLDPEKEGALQYWLNPVDQHLYNHGWYSVKDLEAWIKGEGPIMKSKSDDR